MTETSRGPGVVVPPPLFFVAGWVVAWACSHWIGFQIDGAGPNRFQAGFSAALFAGGLGLMGWALITFLRARTPVMPIRPARVLVTKGPFAVSRNPMYVGLTFAYLGLAGILNQAWPIVFLPIVLATLSVLVIDREEAHLRTLFGTTYEIYSNHVRRWL